MQIISTAIPDVLIFKPKIFSDDRGYFKETFRKNWLMDLGVTSSFVQDNESVSRNGVLRGLHYQLRQPQGKLIRVTKGAVYDVAVDLRKRSPTFRKWVGTTLSEENHEMIWIPPGFAHGFYVLRDGTDCLYRCTEYYVPGDEHCIRWDDPDLNISWPLSNNTSPVISEKDAAGKFFKDAEYFL